jgi:hypothetical protein
MLSALFFITYTLYGPEQVGNSKSIVFYTQEETNELTFWNVLLAGHFP